MHPSCVFLCVASAWCSAGRLWSDFLTAAASATAMTRQMTWCWECVSMLSDFLSHTVHSSTRLCSHSYNTFSVSSLYMCIFTCGETDTGFKSQQLLYLFIFKKIPNMFRPYDNDILRPLFSYWEDSAVWHRVSLNKWIVQRESNVITGLINSSSRDRELCLR